MICLDRNCYWDSNGGSLDTIEHDFSTDRGICFIFLLVINYWFTFHNELLVIDSCPKNLWMLPCRIWFLWEFTPLYCHLCMLICVINIIKVITNVIEKYFLSLLISLLKYFCDIIVMFVLLLACWFIIVVICVYWCKIFSIFEVFVSSLSWL